ncbi:very-long-chain (3R)-3-hydroxyacyl-CoA dehydratase 4 isoform X1 [Dunckerocampus dactyliophorus]|uniref:very-long-chain (3R)-3-hydroxyacyl-CoA dehydratase 4 isoform X1 n=1 Tax=Dunckerocampus dactyliophorus TaxID=161453 RepID=UPI002406CBEC|nr:very-long-chain (3R)-3-hydroxyacyl-CoA dehydratase 4 isoform X1 [Dunckerocampus dactyliophorus]
MCNICNAIVSYKGGRTTLTVYRVPHFRHATPDFFQPARLSFRLGYIFSYNLLQFCGHTWILTNTIIRFFTFGQDAIADTFYAIGLVMSLCQLLSILELFHIADGIEEAKLLPRLIQVLEKNLLLIMLILLEEFQSKPVVCVQLFFWNILDLLRYPHEVLCVIDTPFTVMLWARYTLWIPVYVLSVITEGVTIYQAMLDIEQEASAMQNSTDSSPSQQQFVLTASVPLLALGASFTVWQSLKERQHQLERWTKKTKKK